jgi:Arc/MetJ-type ribon-helix-helix transcriptional regulator
MKKGFMERSEKKAESGGSGSLARQIKAQAIPLAQLVREDPFKSLFDINPDVLARIKADIAENGFNESKTVDVWKRQAAAGGTEYVLVDGFTRTLACEQLGLLSIMSYVREFGSEAEAVRYAAREQSNRRNLNDAELLRVIGALDELKSPGRQSARIQANSSSERGKSADRTARAAGVRRHKVEQARAVNKHADLKDKVLKGKLPLRRAAAEAKSRTNPEKRKPKPAPTVTVTLSRANAESALAMVRKGKPSSAQAAIIKALSRALARP